MLERAWPPRVKEKNTVDQTCASLQAGLKLNENRKTRQRRRWSPFCDFSLIARKINRRIMDSGRSNSALLMISQAPHL
ncbi:Oidioi.mRNA.OKI2018_I69.chr1.g401.t2.cds [Oikopleura dioica]|uniref:Oidioi.mRNA.OKI2018_I69.chr1.g401.t2.cds n=1 Tax=Oikopleura dioica TaxID=34765 RepID=A0ABN7SP51_OIKDI|nr:Oidioi.mRNA.OKI2018_I69.chr1.g401.t2.cds [Oikopleura dioica]